MKHLNPYAPPQSQDLREAPYARFVRCSYAAIITGALFAVFIALATQSLLYGCAAVCASMTLHFLLAALIAWLTETLSWPKRDDAEPETMEHHKVSMPEPRHQSRYCTATAAGYALPQILGFIVCLLGTLLFIPVVYFIFITVMGMEEPRW